jgi:hypothetical protein
MPTGRQQRNKPAPVNPARVLMDIEGVDVAAIIMLVSKGSSLWSRYMSDFWHARSIY